MRAALRIVRGGFHEGGRYEHNQNRLLWQLFRNFLYKRICLSIDCDRQLVKHSSRIMLQQLEWAKRRRSLPWPTETVGVNDRDRTATPFRKAIRPTRWLSYFPSIKMWPSLVLSKRNRDGTRYDLNICSAGQLALGFSDGCYSGSLMRVERLVAHCRVWAYLVDSCFRSSNSSVVVWSMDAMNERGVLFRRKATVWLWWS